MQSSKHLFWAVLILVLIPFRARSVFAETADAQQVVYENDFEETVGPEWSASRTDTTPKGHRRFLGQFGNETVTLTLDDLPPHSTVTVSFDLFIIRSWDGDHPNHGRDVWSLSARGIGTLLHMYRFS